MGKQVHPSLVQAEIRMPVDYRGSFLFYNTNVIDVNLPILFGLDMMKRLSWHVNEFTDELIKHRNESLRVLFVYKKGQFYLELPNMLVLFTQPELQKIHNRFAHPSPDKRTNLLRRARPLDTTSETCRILQKISEHCRVCQVMAPKPYVFQVTMPDNILFNHEIEMDLVWIEPRPHQPALHIVDRGTHFSAAKFLPGESAADIWNLFIERWVTVYVGFPNVIGHDQSSALTSDFFKKSCREFGIILKEIPTESLNSLAICERYHAPLRRIYLKLKIEYPSLNKNTRLSLAVQGLNNTAGSDGLIPTLLVFGMVPKIPIGNLEHIPPTQRELFQALETLGEKWKSSSLSNVSSLQQSHGVNKSKAFDIPIGSKILIYREKPKKWKGPYTLVSYDVYKTVEVLINGEKFPFSTTVVKKFSEPLLLDSFDTRNPDSPSLDTPNLDEELPPLTDQPSTNEHDRLLAPISPEEICVPCTTQPSSNGIITELDLAAQNLSQHDVDQANWSLYNSTSTEKREEIDSFLRHLRDYANRRLFRASKHFQLLSKTLSIRASPNQQLTKFKV